MGEAPSQLHMENQMNIAAPLTAVVVPATVPEAWRLSVLMKNQGTHRSRRILQAFIVASLMVARLAFAESRITNS